MKFKWQYLHCLENTKQSYECGNLSISELGLMAAKKGGLSEKL